jgi:sec-independent protein translocase protein TatC
MSDGGGATTPEDDFEMGFFDHLRELRSRLMKALFGIVPCVIFCWQFRVELMDIILRPLMLAYEMSGRAHPNVNFANPVDPLVAYMQVAIIAGLLMATPWVFYQIWAFIAPGLYRRERLLAIPFVLVSTVFFAGGALFGYLIVFPAGLNLFLSYSGALPSGITIEPEIMIDEYLGSATRMLLAFGVVFEVPVILTFLALADVVTWQQLLKFSRWWIVLSSIISAVLTPPDVASQMMMMVPLVVLYMLGVLIAWIVQSARGKKKKPKEDEGYEE